MGLIFHKKSLEMGLIFVKKFLEVCPISQIMQNTVKSAIFEVETPLEVGPKL